MRRRSLWYFNPRSPRGGATPWPSYSKLVEWIFQSTLPTRGSDHFPRRCILQHRHISIHAPHEGERLTPYQPAPPVDIFQSTLPTRGSDGDWWWIASWTYYNFNPRSPRGGATCAGREFCGHLAGFQSTLPTRGSDYQSARRRVRQRQNFNPRSPRGGATIDMKRRPRSASISIHAPHEGERLLLPRLIFRKNHFNPRSPRGGATRQCRPKGEKK